MERAIQRVDHVFVIPMILMVTGLEVRVMFVRVDIMVVVAVARRSVILLTASMEHVMKRWTVFVKTVKRVVTGVDLNAMFARVITMAVIARHSVTRVFVSMVHVEW